MSLRDVATPDLEHLRKEVRRGTLACPFSEAGLVASGVAHLAPRLGVLWGLDRTSVLAVLEGVLAERTVRENPVELVWTGPEARVSDARDTAIVVQELFAAAQRSVLIAGYAFDHGAELLASLHRSMRDRSVDVEIFLDAAGAKGIDAGVAAKEAFLSRNWSFGPPFPAFFVDARSLDAAATEFASLHAKCVVVDAARALVTSANFTDRGHMRNVEVGVLVTDAPFAASLLRQWRGAVEAGLFKRV